MASWVFTSDNEWFSLTFPDNWSEYEDEDATYSFFNFEKWSGNLRITPFRWEDASDGIDKVSQYNQSTITENANAKYVKLGDWDTVFYIEESTDDELAIYYWQTGIKNNLFLCSFTFDKAFSNTDWHNNELIIVSDILKSIKLPTKYI